MADPFETADELRAKAPLVRTRLPIMGKVWVTTTQAAFGAVLKDPSLFAIRKADGGVTGVQWWMPKTISLLANNMLTMDEPDHTRLRKLVDTAFSRSFILGLEPRIQATADRIAGQLFAGDIRADLVSGFARKLPLEVISELLGIRDQDRNMFARWAESLLRIEGIVGFLKALLPIRKMRFFIAGEIERQRTDPGEGLIGQLTAMQKAGEPITDDELIAMVFLLLLAGYETTTHVLSGGIFELLRHEEQNALAAGGSFAPAFGS